MAVHDVQHQPNQQQTAQGIENLMPRLRGVTVQPRKQQSGGFAKTNKTAGQVNY